MKTDRILFPAMIFAITAFTSILEARTWTEAGTGRTVDGEFVESDGENVVIKQAGGRTLKIPITRLSEADKTFIKSQSPAKPGTPGAAIPSGGGGPLAKLAAPVAVKGLPIEGEGDDRKSGIEVTNNGDRDIKGLVVQMLFLKADGSVGKSVPHTHSGFYGLKGDVLGKGKTFTVDVNSFFMKDDTASLGALLTELTYDDDSTWPAPPANPPARNGDDPVAVVMIGVLGEGDKSEPVVACHNYDAKDVKSVSYRIQYLDADGKELDTTSYGHGGGGDDPILPAGKDFVLAGGDGPPEGAVDAKVNVTRLEFSDDTEWKPAP